jgi:hypothetical protein
MENKEKTLYRYFLHTPGKIEKISGEEEHKKWLLQCIRKIYPTFMHPYTFGRITDREAKDSKNIINIFENNRMTGFRRLKLKLRRFFSK